tara:strand:+ start:7659 stop:7964 length:306 start_codon:yes stop_codon:yes gene_type:complete
VNITIGATKFQVHVVKNVKKTVKNRHPQIDEELQGFCADGHIWIEKSDPKTQARILFHEMLHTCNLAEHPELEEIRVEHTEHLIFPLLWKYGWRPFGDLEQ